MTSAEKRLREIRRDILRYQRETHRGIGKLKAGARRNALITLKFLRRFFRSVLTSEAYGRVVAAESDGADGYFRLYKLAELLYGLADPPHDAKDLESRSREVDEMRKEAQAAANFLRLYTERITLTSKSKKTLLEVVENIERFPLAVRGHPINFAFDFSLVGKHLNKRAFAIRSVAELVPAEMEERYATIAALLRLAGILATNKLVRTTLVDDARRDNGHA